MPDRGACVQDSDKPVYGGNYVCPAPGGYKLQRGRLTPFPRACESPTMLVSHSTLPLHQAFASHQSITQLGCVVAQ